MPKVTLSNIQMNYETFGDGQPLVLIPGLYSTTITSSLNLIRPELAQKYKVIIADNRGCGYSSVGNIGFTTQEMADDWVKLFDVLNIPKAHVISSSMGSMVAQYIALNNPDRVKSLILADSAPICTKYLSKFLEICTLVLQYIDYADFSRLVNLFSLTPDYVEENIDKINRAEAVAKQILSTLPPFVIMGER